MEDEEEEEERRREGGADRILEVASRWRGRWV